MKRNCLNTNEPFKRGAIREDGFVFFAYTKIIKSDGYFKEIWLSPEASEKIRQKDRAQKKAKYQRKSQRHSPGFKALSPLFIRIVHHIKRLDDDQRQHQDMSINDIAEQLAEYTLAPEEWNVIQDHSGPVCFDLKEAIRLALSI